jgi:SAM-dependent methyltransferase
MTYLDTMRSLWVHKDREALKHRVGARQFTPEFVEWYSSMIFPDSWWLNPHWPDHVSVLDYGCGLGRLVRPLAERYWGQWTGVDISPEMIRHAKDGAPKNAQFYVCDGNGIPADLGLYNKIYSVITLQHICSHKVIQEIFSSFRAHLKPTGTVTVQVKKWRSGLRPWSYEPPEGKPPEVLPGLPSLPAQFHVEEGNAYTPEELRTVFGLAGLEVYAMHITQPIDDHGEWLWAYARIANDPYKDMIHE